MRLISDGRQIEIASAQVAHTARYTCIATNAAGDLERNFDLEVLGNYPTYRYMYKSQVLPIAQNFAYCITYLSLF